MIMNEMKVWIRTKDSTEEVQQYILSLVKESKEYAGNIRVVIFNPNSEEWSHISHIYDVSETAINVLKEHYGDLNIKLVGKSEEGTQEPMDRIADSLERIADTLEHLCDELGCINAHLRSIDDIANTVYDLGECIGDSSRGKMFCVTGNITNYV